MTRDGGASVDEQGTAVPDDDQQSQAPHVVEPDLLWIESVTERLLGTTGRPAAWERTSFDEPVDEPARAAQHEPEPADLPQREAREFDGPVQYGDAPQYFSPAADRPSSPAGAQPLAPEPPRPAATDQPLPGPDDMPPAVLRAALRDALPDFVGQQQAASRPADAVFGDPRWNLPPEEDEPAAPSGPEPMPSAPTDEQFAPPPASPPPPAEPGPPPDAPPVQAAEPRRSRAYVEEPVHSPYFDPQAPPARARIAPSYAGQGYGFPRPSDQLTSADIALRLALLSVDRDLAQAVVRMVAGQGRERSRRELVEAYLDALLDEGQDALPGAAQLRRLLGE